MGHEAYFYEPAADGHGKDQLGARFVHGARLQFSAPRHWLDLVMAGRKD